MASIDYWEAIKSEGPAPEQELVRFGPLGLEPRAEYRGRRKALYTFDQGEALVVSKGLRLLTFREVMVHVVIPGLEGKLNKEQEVVFNDIFWDHGEWADNTFYLKDDTDTFYVSTGIGGLSWDKQAGQYDASNMTVSKQPRKYVAHDLNNFWNSLEWVAEVLPNLVVDLYGKSFDDLPARVQRYGGIYLCLGLEDRVLPVSYGGCVNGLSASTDDNVRAVRGCKILAPQETFLSRMRRYILRGMSRHGMGNRV